MPMEKNLGSADRVWRVFAAVVLFAVSCYLPYGWNAAAVALGALYTDHIDKASILNALKATQAHFSNVREPFTMIEISI